MSSRIESRIDRKDWARCGRVWCDEDKSGVAERRICSLVERGVNRKDEPPPQSAEYGASESKSQRCGAMREPGKNGSRLDPLMPPPGRRALSTREWRFTDF